jgi:hypothetical protein
MFRFEDTSHKRDHRQNRSNVYDEVMARPTIDLKAVLLMTGVILILFIAALRAMGRIWICECGLGLGTFSAWSQETSQHLMDPYSTSHVLHGIIFFAALYPLRRKLSIGIRFILSLLIEIAWELLENSPIIINRYRANTASLDYVGDSILNSVGDVLFVLLGFWLTAKLPWKWSVGLVVIIELLMLLWYRDNLTLNVLMLLWPVEVIRDWQMVEAAS